MTGVGFVSGIRVANASANNCLWEWTHPTVLPWLLPAMDDGLSTKTDRCWISGLSTGRVPTKASLFMALPALPINMPESVLADTALP